MSINDAKCGTKNIPESSHTFEVVGIGANVHDTLITIPKYPTEDTKMRANNIIECGGGPCGTGLVAASKLGADCAYIGVLSDDTSGKFLLGDMQRFGVSGDLVDVKKGYSAFSSFIWLSNDTASRTCVFNKGNLPPLELSESQKTAIKNAEILMVDGNELDAAVDAAKIARESGTKVLYDAGGLYDGIERLLPYADILIPSEEFAMGHTGETTPENAAKALFEKYCPNMVAVTCGKCGGVLYCGGDMFVHYPAFTVDAVDSNGAGDVFHGAFAYALTQNMKYEDACIFSSAVSALKCTKIGARDGVPVLDEVKEFLKERGYNEFKENME